MTMRAAFKQSDVTRAIKGAEAALGRPPTEVVFEPNGGFRLIYGDDAPRRSANPLDRVLAI